jgi:hypothetical protein
MYAVLITPFTGMKYQETQMRCPPKVVAIEERPSEKCGKISPRWMLFMIFVWCLIFIVQRG